MILPTDTTVQPGDGTPVGLALDDLDARFAALPRAPDTGFVRVAVYVGGAPACVDVLDADEASLDPPGDLVALDGAPDPRVCAEPVAAAVHAPRWRQSRTRLRPAQGRAPDRPPTGISGWNAKLVASARPRGVPAAPSGVRVPRW